MFIIKRDTLYIAVDYVDRYLALVDFQVPRSELQLIGVSALYLACKVDEVYVPRIGDFALATAGCYTEE